MPSSNQLQFFLTRAKEAREEAEKATLVHVRERCHRSEAAWTELADRAAKAEAMRAKIEKMKAQKVAEEMKNEEKNAQESRLMPHASQPCED